MCTQRLRSVPPAPALLALLALALVARPQTAHAAPALGFRENWSGTTTHGWDGGFGPGIVYTNPGAGGAENDGYLHIASATVANFGTRSVGPEYVGNWLTAGITQVRFWLNDVGAQQNFEIHFAVGNFNDLWQYNPGFIPPLDSWAEFTVDLSDSTQFTHTIALDGLGYLAALQNVAVVHIRHDHPPFMQQPDPISGDLGVDELLLTNGTVGVGIPDGGVERPVALAPPYPNPSRGPVAIVVEGAGPIHVQIVDVLGRVVRRAELPGGASRTQIWTWDGMDQSGRRLAAGNYRVRAFTAAGGGASRPLVRVQ